MRTKDVIATSLVTVVVVLHCVGALAVVDLPYAIAVGCDVSALEFCLGKWLGARRYVHSSFWQSGVSLGEWLVLAVFLLLVNVLALEPARESICLGRRARASAEYGSGGKGS